MLTPHKMVPYYMYKSVQYKGERILTNNNKQLKSTGVEYTVEKNKPSLSKYCSLVNTLKIHACTLDSNEYTIIIVL